MPTLTPAEKSAQQVHSVKGDPSVSLKATWCGIRFRRQRFLETNTTSTEEFITCDKCKAAKAKEPVKPKAVVGLKIKTK